MPNCLTNAHIFQRVLAFDVAVQELVAIGIECQILHPRFLTLDDLDIRIRLQARDILRRRLKHEIDFAR